MVARVETCMLSAAHGITTRGTMYRDFPIYLCMLTAALSLRGSALLSLSPERLTGQNIYSPFSISFHSKIPVRSSYNPNRTVVQSS